MRTPRLKSCCLTVLFAFCLQSLADIAREEAERRRRLEQEGIGAKVIDTIPPESAQNGNVSISTSPLPAAPKKSSGASGSAREQKSARSFRTALQKLDKAIRQNESKLESRRARLHSERRKPAGGRETRAQDRLEEEIESLEMKLNELRRERSEIYGAGIREGLLPGELDGKGIIP